MATHVQNYKALLETRNKLNEEIEHAEEAMVMASENQTVKITAFIEKLRQRLKTYKHADAAIEYLTNNLACAPMYCTEEWDVDNIAITVYYKLNSGQSIMYTTAHADGEILSYFGYGGFEEIHEDQPDNWNMSEDLFDKIALVEKLLKKGLSRNKDIPSVELQPFWPLLLICRTHQDMDIDEVENLCLDYCQFVDDLAGLGEEEEEEEKEDDPTA